LPTAIKIIQQRDFGLSALPRSIFAERQDKRIPRISPSEIDGADTFHRHLEQERTIASPAQTLDRIIHNPSQVGDFGSAAPEKENMQ
jgi:hypothetical protein